MWLAVVGFSESMEIPEEAGLRLMFNRIAALLAQGDGAFLGPEWVTALKKAKDSNYGVIDAGPPIDIDKLHKSGKTKSGYVGVYANGKGFRAMAKVEGVETYIGQFDSAIEAAWRRYVYYKDNRIPYGELEIDIAIWRARGEQGTDLEIAQNLIEHSKMIGTFHIYEKDARAMGLTAEARGPGPEARALLAPASPTGVGHPADTTHLLNEEHHDTGLINEEAMPMGFTELPPMFRDDYVPGKR